MQKCTCICSMIFFCVWYTGIEDVQNFKAECWQKNHFLVLEATFNFIRRQFKTSIAGFNKMFLTPNRFKVNRQSNVLSPRINLLIVLDQMPLRFLGFSSSSIFGFFGASARYVWLFSTLLICQARRIVEYLFNF